MINDASKQLSRYFAAGCRDRTPVTVGHMAHLLYMPVSFDSDVSSLCASVLSFNELQRSGRLKTGADKSHFNQRRAFRRYCGAAAIGSQKSLGDIDFSETETGQPFLSGFPDLSFGFSSCQNGFLGAWSSTSSVGVDIESNTRQMDLVALADQFFSATEATLGY